MTDRDGNLVQHYGYYPFGSERYENNQQAFSVSNRYTGQILDEDTGLYYYGARYYDPQLGRFIQADPIVPGPDNSQAFNRYSYCFNNPLQFIDPTGHAPKEPRDLSRKATVLDLFPDGSMYGAGSTWVNITGEGLPVNGVSIPAIITMSPGFTGADALSDAISGTATYGNGTCFITPNMPVHNYNLSAYELLNWYAVGRGEKLAITGDDTVINAPTVRERVDNALIRFMRDIKTDEKIGYIDMTIDVQLNPQESFKARLLNYGKLNISGKWELVAGRGNEHRIILTATYTYIDLMDLHADRYTLDKAGKITEFVWNVFHPKKKHAQEYPLEISSWPITTIFHIRRNSQFNNNTVRRIEGWPR